MQNSRGCQHESFHLFKRAFLDQQTTLQQNKRESHVTTHTMYSLSLRWARLARETMLSSFLVLSMHRCAAITLYPTRSAPRITWREATDQSSLPNVGQYQCRRHRPTRTVWLCQSQDRKHCRSDIGQCTLLTRQLQRALVSSHNKGDMVLIMSASTDLP